MSNNLLCNTCSKTISSEYVSLSEDRNYHPECFRCSHCKKSLAGEQYYEMDNQLFCENDYHTLYSAKCGACNQIILDDHIEVMGSSYHNRCFVCQGCNKVLGGIISLINESI